MNAWYEANQQYLLAAINQVYNVLERYVAKLQGSSVVATDAQPSLKAIAATMPALPALEQLCQRFHLAEFERNTLLLCAGFEIDPRFAALCAAAGEDSYKNYPTFSLVLAAWSQFGLHHWSALTPDSPLRYWQLITMGEGPALIYSPLRIDERILHYLAGLQTRDKRLAGIVDLPPLTSKLVASHQTLVQQIAVLWQARSLDATLPIVQLCGVEQEDQQAIARAVCDKLGLKLCLLPAHYVPQTVKELEELLCRWGRETILEPRALLLNCDEIDRLESSHCSAIAQLIELIAGCVFITSREPLQRIQRGAIRFDIPKPNSQEQLAIWHESTSELKSQLNGQAEQVDGMLHRLTDQFNLSTTTIRRACITIVGQVKEQSTSLNNILWETCRVQARPRLDELAQRIDAISSWQDLVLPKHQERILCQIVAYVRQRATVYENWGFAAKSKRGLGISVLFSGTSGTGKTLAAEVLAQELRLDLYKIDLSSVISKYIGETEKNLQRIFDAAATGGVILLFDEADALFGKRSEVKDSRDRYANIEVSYLLQQMEAYPGLAILTTNLQSHLDNAFLRRIRFVVHFPFPDPTQRAEIWRRVFPAATPTEGLDSVKLAQLNLAGGNIRNIALNAAFLAADAAEPVQMQHLLQAAQAEYTKLEKSLTETEIAGWL